MKALLRIMILLTIGGVLAGCAQSVATPTSVQLTPVPPTAVQPKAGRLLLATTTSTRDSGLLDFILPDFEKAFNVKVDVVAVGSGQALKIGQDGNATHFCGGTPTCTCWPTRKSHSGLTRTRISPSTVSTR